MKGDLNTSDIIICFFFTRSLIVKCISNNTGCEIQMQINLKFTKNVKIEVLNRL